MDGRVRYQGDFLLLKPLDLAKGNRRLLCDVNNRDDDADNGNDNGLGPNQPDPISVTLPAR